MDADTKRMILLNQSVIMSALIDLIPEEKPSRDDLLGQYRETGEMLRRDRRKGDG